MNFYKKFIEWNNDEWLIKQRTLDNKLSKLYCYDITSKYLLYIREQSRQQKELFKNASLLEYPYLIEKITKDNDNILQDLNITLDQLDPCNSLKEWIIKRPYQKGD
jgi:hypothetical protein